MSRFKRIAALASICAMASVSSLNTTPASASVSQGVIAGTGTVTNDWGDEGELSSTSFPKSNATALWQNVLWAEKATELNGTSFDASDIDCSFGLNTIHATKSLQKRWGLQQDGKVGPETFGKADNNLTRSTSNPTRVAYSGEGRITVFNRHPASGYWVEDHGFWFPAKYTGLTGC